MTPVALEVVSLLAAGMAGFRSMTILVDDLVPEASVSRAEELAALAPAC